MRAVRYQISQHVEVMGLSGAHQAGSQKDKRQTVLPWLGDSEVLVCDILEIMRKYIVRFREVGSSRVGETTYSGPLSKEGVIEFFDLDGSDVEWYEVEEVTE